MEIIKRISLMLCIAIFAVACSAPSSSNEEQAQKRGIHP